MSSIKLTADSGGGTFEIKAPSSSGNTRVLTVPDAANGTVLTTTSPKAGTIVQKVMFSAATSTYSASTSYTETVVTGSITPESSSSKIIITACVPTWPASDYLHVQLRSSGGNTNNDIGTWGDVVSAQQAQSFNCIYQWLHSSHNTTSAITYKIFVQKESSSGGNWYFPNNNGDAQKTIGWFLTLEEQSQ